MNYSKINIENVIKNEDVYKPKGFIVDPNIKKYNELATKLISEACGDTRASAFLSGYLEKLFENCRYNDLSIINNKNKIYELIFFLVEISKLDKQICYYYYLDVIYKSIMCSNIDAFNAAYYFYLKLKNFNSKNNFVKFVEKSLEFSSLEMIQQIIYYVYLTNSVERIDEMSISLLKYCVKRNKNILVNLYFRYTWPLHEAITTPKEIINKNNEWIAYLKARSINIINDLSHNPNSFFHYIPSDIKTLIINA